MTETLMRELIDVLNQNNRVSWETIINILALAASWFTIAFLLLERRESTRPYLQISFELVKDNLVCLVFRNVGTTPLTIKSLDYENDFIEQLPISYKKYFENKNDVSIDVFPNKHWVICLGVTTPEVMQNFEKKNLTIKYEYSKKKNMKRYKDSVIIDFEQYGGFMVYISETDELKRVNKEISKSIEKNTQQLKRIYSMTEKYANLEDTHQNFVAGLYEDESVNE